MIFRRRLVPRINAKKKNSQVVFTIWLQMNEFITFHRIIFCCVYVISDYTTIMESQIMRQPNIEHKWIEYTKKILMWNTPSFCMCRISRDFCCWHKYIGAIRHTDARTHTHIYKLQSSFVYLFRNNNNASFTLTKHGNLAEYIFWSVIMSFIRTVIQNNRMKEISFIWLILSMNFEQFQNEWHPINAQNKWVVSCEVIASVCYRVRCVYLRIFFYSSSELTVRKRIREHRFCLNGDVFAGVSME